MKIGIDARLYGLEHTGIGRYVMELVHHLLAHDQKNHYTIFATSDDQKRLPKNSRLKIIPTDIRHYTLKEQLVMPKLVDRQGLDFVHIPHFNVPIFLKTPFIVTVHDLLWHEVMGYGVTTLGPFAYSLKYLGYRLVVKRAVGQALRILVPSTWVKNQILSRFSLDEAKVTVTPEGVGQHFRSFKTKSGIKPKDITRTVSVTKPFLVYTGNLYPHKNVVTLIKALRHVNSNASQKVSLVIVSARSDFTQRLRQLAYKLDQAHQVAFVGFLSDQELVKLYQEASALVHPSTSEGFGLTGLEAMAVGLPVISSESASLPEVYGQAALFFNPNSAKDLADKISQVVMNKDLQAKLARSGKSQVKKYSWKRMAQQTLKVYEEVGGRQN